MAQSVAGISFAEEVPLGRGCPRSGQEREADSIGRRAFYLSAASELHLLYLV